MDQRLIVRGMGKLNARQARFVEHYLEGMNQTDAYALAYKAKQKTARCNASKLMLKNASVREAVERGLYDIVDRARRKLMQESYSAAKKIVRIKDEGGKEDSIQLQAAKDILDRVGLKPKEQHEHSGSLDITIHCNQDLNLDTI